ncbi:hypothetical protein MTO96_021136 [Rhipicephalus appendiculatus]
MAEYEEMVRLVDGAYKNILEKFNPCARQLIAAGKTYLKALHAAVAASKGYMDAISRLARHAHQATWGGCTDIGPPSGVSCLELQTPTQLHLLAISSLSPPAFPLSPQKQSLVYRLCLGEETVTLRLDLGSLEPLNAQVDSA